MRITKRWKLSLTLMLALTIASGCSVWPFDKEVYVGRGQYAEIAKPVAVRCWITNKETGARELRIVRAQAGWSVGRPKADPDTTTNGSD